MDEQKFENVGSDAQDDGVVDAMVAIRREILAAALPNVPFDGWSDLVVRTAADQAGVPESDAQLAFPRGGVDLALFFHDEGDRVLAERMRSADLASMRIRERVAFGVRTRLEIADDHREAVRRGAALFALPLYAADGARAVWSTADTIWTALGDASEDLNWYTKRTLLAGVYGSTTLYWLQDESEGKADSWAFLNRRIEGVMRIEKIKASLNGNPVGRFVMAGPNWFASRIRKPGARAGDQDQLDLPGGA